MHEAEAYLRSPQNPSSLYVIIEGKKRRLFINKEYGQIGIIAPRKKTHGYIFGQWEAIEKIIYPKDEAENAREKEIALTRKFKKLASKASFTNPYIRKVLAADENKTPYENHLTCGTKIDGEVISFKALERWCGTYMIENVKRAIKERTPYKTGQFDFRGYDGSISVEYCSKNDDEALPGDIRAFLSKEFRGTGNGYYYLLINDENFIGYDID